MTNRRQFLAGLGVAFLVPSQGVAAGGGHPLSFLENISTRRGVEPDGRFALVLCMTAQKIPFTDCGAAFDGIKAALDACGRDKVRPLLVMPNVQDQVDPNNRENLILVTTHYKSTIGFTILTGRTAEMRRVNSVFDRAFDINANGKVERHSLDAFLLSTDGELLLRQRAEDFVFSTDQIESKIELESGWMPRIFYSGGPGRT